MNSRMHQSSTNSAFFNVVPLALKVLQYRIATEMQMSLNVVDLSIITCYNVVITLHADGGRV